ncbi:head maturation protease, ClpP-related [Rhizobium rhizogenes]|uniref:head maturation protease, ClpP-related n=1 Tax=Rhizobium rhizogenes TaxID=359 RepID=UPI001571D03A|nr:head maturation protease, ClpP-related [Rhizobium rhizogenes]NTI27659.1 Clp protease ClpP [Rhizobium rhizogenes]
MNLLVNGELVLYGFVGDSFWDVGFTSRDVIDALAEVGRDTDLTVRINSGGGYIDDGIAIFNALSAHKGKVTVIVDALAASSASIIAMAGEERIMRKGAMLMIHDPANVVWGTASDMEKMAATLEKYAVNMVGIYADVSGEDPDDIRADMKEELWLGADEAVERGYATAVNDNKSKAAAAHDYRVYAHAPDRLVALSTKKNWSHAETRPKALASATAEPRPTKEQSMTTANTAADIVAAENEKAVANAASQAKADAKARIKAITGSDEAKGREALAEHFAFDTDMTPEASIAALALAPKAAAPTADQQQTYEEQRLAASALAAPGGKPAAKATIDRNAIFASRRNSVKGE